MRPRRSLNNNLQRSIESASCSQDIKRRVIDVLKKNEAEANFENDYISGIIPVSEYLKELNSEKVNDSIE